MAYTVTPLMLNVGLSWMNFLLLEKWTIDFSWIVVTVFIIGILAFLLPMVPGMTIYIFGGLVISGVCPYGNGKEERFWWGTIINIVVGFVLKLVACAIQQKCIGGFLSKIMLVRQTVGVHKVQIRCIEAVLRKPGLSVGKCAILCGGPDWPTSVLAGVLNLSLYECEFGTVPIIFFVAPCALTGSFYMRKGESDAWDSAANMMIVISLAVNMGLWAVAAWAIQDVLDKHHEELTRPLKVNCDLHWLDYKSDQIKQQTAISWADVPNPIRYIYGLGILVHVLVCWAVTPGYSSCFGAFEVSDDINTLVWVSWNSDAIFTPLGLFALGAYLVGLFGYLVFYMWQRRRAGSNLKEISDELDRSEAEWKEQFCREADEAERAAANKMPAMDAPEVDTVESSAPKGMREDALDNGTPPMASTEDRGGEEKVPI